MQIGRRGALGSPERGSLLAACGNSTTPTASTNSQGKPVGPGGLPLARPDNPVKLPLWEDPIKSGLKPETGGTFTVYNYPAYLYKKLLNEFCAKYDVTPQYTPFDNIATGIQKLADRDGAARRHGDDPRSPRPGGRGAPHQAAQPGLHPQPPAEHLAGARGPVLRQGQPVHRPLHALCDRHPLAHRSRHRGHRRYEAALGHLLAGPGVLGQGLHADGGPGDHRGGPAAQGGHRHQHRGPEADQSSGRRPEAAVWHLQHQA